MVAISSCFFKASEHKVRTIFSINCKLKRISHCLKVRPITNIYLNSALNQKFSPSKVTFRAPLISLFVV